MGLHVRSAVVLVRATVAEAFRVAKRGGGPKSALADLRAEGLEGIVLVLSPNARNVVTMDLERKPSGTEKSACMSYMSRGGVAKVVRCKKRQGESRSTSTSGLAESRDCMNAETENVVDGSKAISGEVRGGELGG